MKFQLSARWYWGLQVDVPYNEDSIKMVKSIKEAAASFFRSHNLVELAEGVLKLDLHIHVPYTPHQDEVVYVCACEEAYRKK